MSGIWTNAPTSGTALYWVCDGSGTVHPEPKWLADVGGDGLQDIYKRPHPITGWKYQLLDASPPMPPHSVLKPSILRIGNLELRRCDDCLRIDRDFTTAEIVLWEHCPQIGREACCAIAYWIRGKE